MTNETEQLRDRIAEIVNAALVAWNTDMDTQYSEGEYVAQAIIDEFGLTVETVGGFVSVAGNHDARRVVGKWERCD